MAKKEPVDERNLDGYGAPTIPSMIGQRVRHWRLCLQNIAPFSLMIVMTEG